MEECSRLHYLHFFLIIVLYSDSLQVKEITQAVRPFRFSENQIFTTKEQSLGKGRRAPFIKEGNGFSYTSESICDGALGKLIYISPYCIPGNLTDLQRTPTGLEIYIQPSVSKAKTKPTNLQFLFIKKQSKTKTTCDSSTYNV